MEVCRHLRWKGYDEELEPEEIVLAAVRNTVPYTCLRTCQTWGVDDGQAAPETCVRGRPCFAPRQPVPPTRPREHGAAIDLTRSRATFRGC